MLIFTKKNELSEQLETLRNKGLKLGFVPTMGALHKGHISLIETSRQQADVTICSVFVNPTQFNDKGDLERYPRTPEQDTAMLREAGCDILFLPSVAEIYDGSPDEQIDLGYLNHILEAAHRPGHFDGVAQVVSRFFKIVKPDLAFFGSKDYQQVMVVKRLAEVLHLPVHIIACPIIRESDGLAMSSRNTLLSAEERQAAAQVPQLLNQAKALQKQNNPDTVRRNITEMASAIPNSRLDYFEIADALTLKPLQSWQEAEKAVALVAIYIGRTRLIDNLILY